MPNGGSASIQSIKAVTQAQDELAIVVSFTAVKEHLSGIELSIHWWRDPIEDTGWYNPEYEPPTETISEDQIASSSGQDVTYVYSLPVGASYVRAWARLVFKEKENPNQTGNTTKKDYYGGFTDDPKNIGKIGKSDWSGPCNWAGYRDGWVKLPDPPQYSVLESGTDSNGATRNSIRVWLNDIRPTSPDGLNYANEVWFEFWDGRQYNEIRKIRVWNGGSLDTFVTTAPETIFTMQPGGLYFVRATTARYGDGVYPNFNDTNSISNPMTQSGDIMWTEWVPDSWDGILAVPTGLEWADKDAISAVTTSSVRLRWKGLEETYGYTYEVLYADNVEFLKTDSGEIQSAETQETAYIVTGLEKGHEYFFKVRAKNDTGVGQATSIKSIILGKAPSAPTTWSDTTTAKQGRKVRLYWTHNSEDSSIQKYAQVELYRDGVLYRTETYDTDSMPENSGKDEEDKEITSSYILDTNTFPSGAVITWRVRTAGVLKDSAGKPVYSAWSITRTVEIFAKPTLAIKMDGNTLEKFPLDFRLIARPANYKVTSYSVSICAKTSYINYDITGTEVKVGAGEEIYHRYIDTKLTSDYFVRIYPDEISLSGNNSQLGNNPGQEYVINASVAFENGLTEDAPPVVFDVGWKSKMNGVVSATTSIDPENLTARIQPVYLNQETGQPVSPVSLFVYRRTYDGNYISLGGAEIDHDLPIRSIGFPNNGGTAVFDPHPPLDYANYRVVAMDDNTGEIDFADLYPQPVGEIYAVIQWEESWPNYYQYYNGPGKVVQPNWSGTMLKLPWNLDVSDKWSPQTSAVEYIGREHPVGYYGTQVGATSSWKLDVVKADREMIAKLRRLATYKGNVYVREPYGSGYWAMVKVSFSQNHTNVVVPVTLDITRVDGGV